MNNSSFGQWMTMFIFVIPAGIVSYVFFANGSHASSGGSFITTLATWVLVALSVAVLLYLVTPFIWKHRDKSKGLATGAIGVIKEVPLNGLSGKGQMFWLITTLIIAYFASLVFEPEKAVVVRAIVVLIGFHLVWWLLSTGKSWLTPVIVYGIGAYMVLAWIQPTTTSVARDASLGLTGKLYASAVGKLWSANETYGKTEAPATAQPAVRAPIVTTESREIDLYDEWSPEIEIPPGKAFDFWCSDSGAKVVMFFSGGTSMHQSGVPFPCSTKDDNTTPSGDGIKNLRLSFRRAGAPPYSFATVIY